MVSKTTKSQLIANRHNAQRSTGPRTPQGKAVVSKNAVKHGLSAAQTLIKSEDREEFDLHRTQLLDELAPQNPIESMLAERIVSLFWRLRRAENFQNISIDALNTPNTGPLSKLHQSLLAKTMGTSQNEPSEPDPELALGRMLIKDFSNSRVLEKLLMYERRIENSLFRSLLEVQRINMIKKMCSEHNVPFNEKNAKQTQS